MRLILLFFFLNKYFFLKTEKAFKAIKGLFVSFFFLIEYVCLFILSIKFFYFLILYKNLIKEKFILEQKIKKLKFFNKKAEKVPVLEKKIKKSRVDQALDKFWYIYYRRRMYKDFFIVRLQLYRWEARQYRHYLRYIYHYKYKRLYRSIKKEILGTFFEFYFFFNYFLIRIFVSFKNGFIFFIFFLIGLISYIIDFIKVKSYYYYKKITHIIETKSYKQIITRKKRW